MKRFISFLTIMVFTLACALTVQASDAPVDKNRNSAQQEKAVKPAAKKAAGEKNSKAGPKTASAKKAGRIAAEDLCAEFPEATIEVIDSLSASLKEAKELVSFCKDKLTKVEEDVNKILGDGNE